MTTNKPEILGYCAKRDRKPWERSNTYYLSPNPDKNYTVPVIRLSDYETLKAAHEEELFCVRQDRDAHFGELMRAIEQVDELQAECDQLRSEIEVMRALLTESQGKKTSKYKVVPISPSRSIEDAIGRARNLSASEIWEDALAAVSETDMIAITTAEYASSSAMVNRVAELEKALRKASAHIRPTCFELYDELIKTLEPKRVKYGCHCDLEEDMEPDGCVIDTNERHNCVHAKDISVKEQCSYWRVIASDAAMRDSKE